MPSRRPPPSALPRRRPWPSALPRRRPWPSALPPAHPCVCDRRSCDGGDPAWWDVHGHGRRRSTAPDPTCARLLSRLVSCLASSLRLCRLASPCSRSPPALTSAPLLVCDMATVVGMQWSGLDIASARRRAALVGSIAGCTAFTSSQRSPFAAQPLLVCTRVLVCMHWCLCSRVRVPACVPLALPAPGRAIATATTYRSLEAARQYAPWRRGRTRAMPNRGMPQVEMFALSSAESSADLHAEMLSIQV